MRAITVVLVCLVLPFEARAAAPRLAAVRAPAPPALDGRLLDPVWTTAPLSGAFTQTFPDEGAPASESTQVRVLYDDDALYVGIDCEQVLSPLALRLSRRDREIEADRVSVGVSSRDDGRTAFLFGVTASGVQSDGLYYDDDNFVRSWDENWEAKVARTGHGWSAELRIPLRVLRFDDSPVQAWGFNVRRFISARQETSEWSFAPRSDAGVVSRYGKLDNLVGLSPRHGIELRPFVLAEASRIDAGFGPQVGAAQRFSAGFDAKAHPTQNLTVDVTVNPDFGQVEADEVVLNLSNVETSHPEKRPFFLEGMDAFQTQRRVVYTRRIGSVPGAPALVAGDTLVGQARPTSILGALKVVGRPLPRLTLGALTAVTGQNDVPVRQADGRVVDRLAAPLSIYNVLRLQGQVGDGGQLGFIATAVKRREGDLPQQPGDDPTQMRDTTQMRTLCPSGQTVGAGAGCFRDAIVAGVDARWRSPSRAYLLAGQALASAMIGGPPRTQRDGTVIAGGDVAPLLAFNLAKEGGDRWLWGLWGQFTGRKADTSDLGFMERQNEARVMANLVYRTTRAWGPTLQSHSRLEAYQQTDLAGLPVSRYLSLETNWQLRNFWWAGLRAVANPTTFDDREVGDGAAVERAPRVGGELELSTDPRRGVVGELELGGRRLSSGLMWNAEATLRVRALSRLDIDIEPEVSFRSGEPRYLSHDTVDAGTRYLLGRLRATSAGTTLRLTWTFTPQLTLQTYAQFFLLEKDYSSFTQVTATGPRPRLRGSALSPVAAPAEDPDQREGVANANVLLRWEYRLGSTLYLVYTRSQRPLYDDLAEGMRALDFSHFANAPAANAVLVKLSYWWG